jgi:PAS domain S-box-containing protein
MERAAFDKLAGRIVEGAADAVLFTDREGTIRLWNAGAERIFGWTAAEAIGQSMDLIIPERLRHRHWANWDRVMETGVTRYATEVLAVPALRKDGAPLSIEFTIQLVRDDAGAIVGPVAIVRDVTARFHREKELRARLKELEAAASRAAPAAPATAQKA